MHGSNSLQAVNIPTYHYVAIDLHSTNAEVCVKVNVVDKQGALVGKTIYRGTVSIYDGTEAFEKCIQPVPGVSRILCPGSFSRAAKLTALLFKDSVCHDCVGGVR